ncbi:sugar phosphate isomerase/epimerase family protein [Streptomyces fuscichromogenes]|uniref:sugar phosphate isomerase/epimerase family protein n=1 Tax=Streptomyces fuscichromogenes TaxID=1324013 RepID=UPI0038284F6E
MTALPWPLAYTVSGDDCRAPMPLGFDAPLAEAVVHLAELGYDGVELQVRDVTARDAEALVRVVEGHGLKVFGIGTGPVSAQDGLTLTDPAPDVRRHALHRLLGAARLAGALGVPVTLGQTRGAFLPGLEDLQRAWAERAVREMAEEAASHGSRLLLEPQTRANTSLWNTPDEAVTVLGSLGTAAGLVLDTHHLEVEGLEPVREVAEYVSVTGCLQLAGSATRGPLAVGDYRLPPLLGALREGGFTGWLTLEHTQDGDSTKAAARSWTALTDAATTLT